MFHLCDLRCDGVTTRPGRALPPTWRWPPAATTAVRAPTLIRVPVRGSNRLLIDESAGPTASATAILAEPRPRAPACSQLGQPGPPPPPVVIRGGRWITSPSSAGPPTLMGSRPRPARDSKYAVSNSNPATACCSTPTASPRHWNSEGPGVRPGAVVDFTPATTPTVCPCRRPCAASSAAC